MRVPRNLGMLLLAVWFILFGLLTVPFLHLSIAHSGDGLAVLAVVVELIPAPGARTDRRGIPRPDRFVRAGVPCPTEVFEPASLKPFPPSASIAYRVSSPSSDA